MKRIAVYSGVAIALFLSLVIAETITLTRKIGHEDAARLGDQLYGEKLARIHWASPDEERAAFDYFKRHQDQTYSAVDCLNFGVLPVSLRDVAAGGTVGAGIRAAGRETAECCASPTDRLWPDRRASA